MRATSRRPRGQHRRPAHAQRTVARPAPGHHRPRLPESCVSCCPGRRRQASAHTCAHILHTHVQTRAHTFYTHVQTCTRMLYTCADTCTHILRTCAHMHSTCMQSTHTLYTHMHILHACTHTKYVHTFCACPCRYMHTCILHAFYTCACPHVHKLHTHSTHMYTYSTHILHSTHTCTYTFYTHAHSTHIRSTDILHIRMHTHTHIRISFLITSFPKTQLRRMLKRKKVCFEDTPDRHVQDCRVVASGPEATLSPIWGTWICLTSCPPLAGGDGVCSGRVQGNKPQSYT